ENYSETNRWQTLLCAPTVGYQARCHRNCEDNRDQNQRREIRKPADHCCCGLGRKRDMIASSTITTNATAPQKMYPVDPVSGWPTNDGFDERFSSGPAATVPRSALRSSPATRARS